VSRVLVVWLLLTASRVAAQVSFTVLDPVPAPAPPPFVGRVPELGDRWVYSTPVPSWEQLETVEVIGLERWGDGWRALVETRSIPRTDLTEWFFRPSGAVLHGDEWRDGVLAFDVAKPRLLVPAGSKRKQGIRRSGVWDPRAGSPTTWKPGTGSELPVRHRGRLRLGPVLPGAGPWPGAALQLELNVRSRSYCKLTESPFYSELVQARRRDQLLAWYDDTLGLVGWQREATGCGHGTVERVLLSAEVGGVAFPAPEIAPE